MRNAFVASALLHGSLFAGLGVVLATERGTPPDRTVAVTLADPIPLDGEFEPLPDSGPPEIPSAAAAPDLVLPEGLEPEPADPGFAAVEGAGGRADGGTAVIGVGGGGLRIRPRRVAAAPAPAEAEGVGPVPAQVRVLAEPRLSVRARPIPGDCPDPAYPSRERRLGIEGAVLLLVRVDPEGAVGGVELLETSGAAALDRAAMDAVRGWRFSPALEEGTAVEDALRLRITFSLVEAGR